MLKNRNVKTNKTNRCVTVSAIVAVFALGFAPAAEIAVDPTAGAIKDLRMISAAPCCGFHDDGAEYPHSDAQSLFISNRAETAEVFARAGVKLVRPQYALVRWQSERASRRHFYERYRKQSWGQSALNMDRWWSWVPQEFVFSFWKEHGVKAILCLQGEVLDEATGEMTRETEKVKKVVCDYLRWIADNGYQDVVAGFELENEPYFGRDPEGYAKSWAEILPAMKKIWPNAQIGLPLAVYSDGNPDLECVRQRMLATGAISAKKVHTADHVNQWTGNAIVALGEAVSNVTHLVIHVYGADTYYDANIKCVERTRLMQRAFPQLAGKRIWITEWRDRAEEDMRSHRKFRTTLWKAHFLLTMLAQPDVDATCQLSLIGCSGALYLSRRGRWMDGDRKLRDWDFAGRSRLDVGGCGALYRLFNNALQDCPRILAHGAPYGFRTMNTFYDSIVARNQARKAGKEPQPLKGGVEWLAALNAKGDMLAVLAVNSSDREESVDLRVAGRSLGRMTRRTLTCPDPALDSFEVPGEPKPWIVEASEVRSDTLRVPPNAIVVAEVSVKR